MISELCIFMLYTISTLIGATPRGRWNAADDDACYNPWPDLCRLNCSRSIDSMTGCTSSFLTKATWNTSIYGQNLGFHQSGIKVVPGHVFAGVKYISVDFFYTFVYFEEDAFQDFYISNMFIAGNPQLKYLPPGLFRGLTMLKDLYIIFNEKITCLSRDLFVGLESLVILDIFGNNIASIAPDLIYNMRGREVWAFGIEQAHGKPVRGLCRQTFRDIKIEVYGLYGDDYKHVVDKCIVLCSGGVTGLTVTNTTEDCDCSLTEGCVDEPCEDPEDLAPVVIESAAPEICAPAMQALISGCLIGILIPLEMLMI